jgi:deoxyadenosine/deoxycytidine kinase
VIELIGVPGSGKTSLSKLLSVRENIPMLCEPVETNPYLNAYYESPRDYAFKMQVFLLHSMFKHTLKAQKYNQCVMDASMNINDIFVEVQHQNLTMDTKDYNTYKDLSSSLHKMVSKPDLVVYLQCSPETALKRIEKRGRESELAVPFEYWCHINEAYDYWYESYSGSKKICIPVDDIDFVADTSEEDFLIDEIMSHL